MRKGSIRAIILSFLIISVLSQPLNDACTAAKELTSNNIILLGQTLIQATYDTAITCGGISASQPNVWYTFNSYVNDRIRISTCTGMTFDSVMYLYQGTCSTLHCIIANVCSVSSSYSAAVQHNTQYLIAVGTADGSTGTFILEFLIDSFS